VVGRWCLVVPSSAGGWYSGGGGCCRVEMGTSDVCGHDVTVVVGIGSSGCVVAS